MPNEQNKLRLQSLKKGESAFVKRGLIKEVKLISYHYRTHLKETPPTPVLRVNWEMFSLPNLVTSGIDIFFTCEWRAQIQSARL